MTNGSPPMLRLICALPNLGCPGTPRGLFYPNTAAGQASAEQFARRENRPGWGVFDSLCTFKDTAATLETFAWVLKENGWGKG
jgi:hypothetical protein